LGENEALTNQKQKLSYIVRRCSRSIDGQYFNFPVGRRFETEIEARDYAKVFAAELAGCARTMIIIRCGRHPVCEYRVTVAGPQLVKAIKTLNQVRSASTLPRRSTRGAPRGRSGNSLRQS
jgi:hypothetical protein